MVTHLIVVGVILAASESPPSNESGSKAPMIVDPLENRVSPAPVKPENRKPAPPKPVKPLQLEIVVLLSQDTGAPSRVDPTRTRFREGDRIQVQLTSPSSGHAAVAAIGSDGSALMLFPDPALGLGKTEIKAGQSVVLPATESYFEFDSKAGTETLIVILTDQPAEIEQLADNFSRQWLDELLRRSVSPVGAKNLRTVRVEGAQRIEREEGGTIVHRVELTHE